MTDKIKKVISRYNVRLHGDGTQLAAERSIAKHPEDCAFLREHKADIIAYIKAEEDAKARAAAERRAKIAAIEGLEALRSLEALWDEYRARFEQFIDNDAIGRCPDMPLTTLDEARAALPRAAAYLDAERFADAAHYAKSAAGVRAINRILDGEDYSDVIDDMHAEWSSYCNAHAWD